MNRVRVRLFAVLMVLAVAGTGAAFGVDAEAASGTTSTGGCLSTCRCTRCV